VHTAAEVRRAFQAISAALGQNEAPVIVREPPPRGHDLRARIQEISALGPFVVLDVPGHPEPLAAVAPLTEGDARELSRYVSATRAGDPPPDRTALADLLRRASFLVAGRPEVRSMDLARIVVGAQGDRAVVVDVRTELND